MKYRMMILMTIIIIIIIIGGSCIWKVKTDHEQRLVLVSEKRIIEACMTCINEEKCQNKCTLKELENKGYLKKEIHPLKKTYYNEESYVIKNKDSYEFIEK